MHPPKALTHDDQDPGGCGRRRGLDAAKRPLRSSLPPPLELSQAGSKGSGCGVGVHGQLQQRSSQAPHAGVYDLWRSRTVARRAGACGRGGRTAAGSVGAAWRRGARYALAWLITSAEQEWTPLQGACKRGRELGGPQTRKRACAVLKERRCAVHGHAAESPKAIGECGSGRALDAALHQERRVQARWDEEDYGMRVGSCLCAVVR